MNRTVNVRCPMKAVRGKKGKTGKTGTGKKPHLGIQFNLGTPACRRQNRSADFRPLHQLQTRNVKTAKKHSTLNIQPRTLNWENALSQSQRPSSVGATPL